MSQTAVCADSFDSLPRSRPIFDLLVERCHAELTRRARNLLRRESHTIHPTDLLHTAYFKIADARGWTENDEEHFKRLVIHKMKQHIIDYGTKKRRRQRLNEVYRADLIARRPLNDVHTDRHLEWGEQMCARSMNDALERLREVAGENHHRLVELVAFAGYKKGQAAAEIGVSERTGRDYWRDIRNWMERYFDENVLSDQVGGSFDHEAESSCEEFESHDKDTCDE